MKNMRNKYYFNNYITEDRSSVKQESQFMDESFYNEDSGEHRMESEPVVAFEEPMVDLEERQMLVMEKLVLSTLFHIKPLTKNKY